MQIAVIGWGSLIKEAGSLHLRNHEWLPDGPRLPIELSRLSHGRGHLTFVIDERHDRRVRTRYAFSQYRDLGDAVADLACREGCAASKIGFVKGAVRTRHRSRTDVWTDIRTWLQETGIDAAVWTDLPPKFGRTAFTLDTAVKHWRSLSPDKIEAARRYVREAPEEVDTDLRRRLKKEKLW